MARKYQSSRKIYGEAGMRSMVIKKSSDMTNSFRQCDKLSLPENFKIVRDPKMEKIEELDEHFLVE
jgi:hypothetical protein